MRSDLTSALLEACYACPSLRIGQLISDAARAGGWDQFDVFYCPDEKIVKGLRILTQQSTDRIAQATGGAGHDKV